MAVPIKLESSRPEKLTRKRVFMICYTTKINCLNCVGKIHNTVVKNIYK